MQAMIAKIGAFLVLYAKDVQATHNFYTSIGATITQKTEDKVVVELGGYDLHFVLESTEPFGEYQPLTDPFGRGQGVLMYAEVENAESMHQQLVAKGIKPKTQVKLNHWGSKEFWVQDPDGYNLVFYSEED